VNDLLHRFAEIWLWDFEFIARDGERPEPICLVAWELRSGRKIRLWRDEMGKVPPFPLGPDSLFVGFFASAEIGCHLALGWPKPVRVLDLFVEYRNQYNCLPTVTGKFSLLGALLQFGLDAMGATEKTEMRDLVLRGGPWTLEEKAAILDYCEEDVAALARLLPAMLPKIDLPRAIYRGRYMSAVASMEHIGTPVDVGLLEQLRNRWIAIQETLIARVDSKYGVYEGTTFKQHLFERWLARHNIAWPRTTTGLLDTENDTFRDMAKAHPEINELKELRHALSELRLDKLAVGHDGFNRCILSPFGTRSSRNSPSSAKFIFGPSVWMRGLIKPPAGWGVAYIDWKQQEFGIAAALSGDPEMLAAYQTGDPYLAFAKQAKAVPNEATEESHPRERGLYKTCVLGVGYGMEERSLSYRSNIHLLIARGLLQHHHDIYWRFWQWSDNRVSRTMLYYVCHTVFGFAYHVPDNPRPRSIRNFPMQANGAEMMRLAACLGTENGILICAPVHDAFLIMAPLDRLETDVEKMRSHMTEASAVVLNGFKLRTKADIVRYPDRYMDEDRGREFWDKVMQLL